MEFFKKIPQIDFMGLQKWTAIFSITIFVASIVSLCVYGLNLGLDFTGGVQIELGFKQAAQLDGIRSTLATAGFDRAVVQSYGSSRDVQITLPPPKSGDAKAVVDQVMQLLPNAELRRNDFIGPQVGKELTQKGILAVVVSMMLTMLYIMVRFEYRFAVSSTVALIHDPVLILGVFSFFQLEFNLIVLAALLAILGYSLNDTVVVFDRVRENFRKLRKSDPRDVMNLSINQTLSRTTMTSGLTLIVVVALFLYGGETLRGFSLALIIGIVIGTYSSIYVAGSLAVLLGLNKEALMPREKALVDDRP